MCVVVTARMGKIVLGAHRADKAGFMYPRLFAN